MLMRHVRSATFRFTVAFRLDRPMRSSSACVFGSADHVVPQERDLAIRTFVLILR
jgi:hypothetical protein